MSKLGALHLTAPIGPIHSATVIFFHGSGSSGSNLKKSVEGTVKNFAFNEIKIMYPTSPLQPYTMNGGDMSQVWFDRTAVHPEAPDILTSIANIETEVKALIKAENDAGISSSRIVVGGFSMGGALSFHTAYRWDRNLAGAFVCGSFLCRKSVVYDELKKTPRVRTPPLLQIHGDTDKLVNLNWGQETFELLKGLGVEGEFHVMPKLGHSINQQCMIIVKEWIEKILS